MGTFSSYASHVIQVTRNGSDACGGDIGERVEQILTRPPLHYQFDLEKFRRFVEQVGGQNSFDYNV